MPSEILSKPGHLKPVELALLREHAQAGADIVRGIHFPWPIADMILQHHERIDGSGYPLGLVGSEILLSAQIIAVADVVEAMSSDRPYRVRKGLDAALSEIEHRPRLAVRCDDRRHVPAPVPRTPLQLRGAGAAMTSPRARQ